MKKIVFLDRDGTLNVDKGYTYKIEDFKLLEGVIDGLIKLRDNGFEFIIVTNQAGIGRGYYSEVDFQRFMAHMLNELEKNCIKILGTYFCPHHPDNDCECRKPKLGLLKKISADFPDIDFQNSYLIGDGHRDIGFGKNIRVRKTILIEGESEKKFDPDYIAKEFLDAANYICSQ